MKDSILTKDFKAFKDGVYDAVIHGNRKRFNEHYYKTGYDFGMTIWSDLQEQEQSYEPTT